MSRPRQLLLMVVLLLVPSAARAADTPFDGVWETNLGRMRLIQEGNSVLGIYAYQGISTLEGRIEGRTLRMTYTEPTSHGEAELTLSADGQELHGAWHDLPHDSSGEWVAERVEARAGVRWLLVLEANWELTLDEREHTRGELLRSYFDAMPGVEVRHRIFHDGDDLARQCAEAALLPEPVVVCVCAHGAPDGIAAHGLDIGPESIVEGLQYAVNLELLHFTSCSVLQENLGQELEKSLDPRVQAPISGYGRVVNWVNTAAIELVYFHLVLCQDVQPAEAARQVHTMMALAGAEDLPGVSIPGADFRIVLPETHGSQSGRQPQSEHPAAPTGRRPGIVNPVN